ncbi:HrpN-interacting protein from malus protein [Zea mays]|uniref:HrpN-interacting protein from malus protein n=1 Tax=Zea mays TaxID=4577 RepID=K7V667_MAIZE|nr:HrpN-interacting protein from malus protein [Zea mays]
MGMGGRGVVGDRWSQRILWICALGSAVSKRPYLKKP